MKKLLLSILLFSFTATGHAATDLLMDNVLQFNCGLNSNSSPFALKPCELTEAQNVNFTLDGSVQRRDGNAKLASAAFNTTNPQGLYDFIQQDGSQDTVAIANGEIDHMDALDGTFHDITGVYKNELLCTDIESTDGTWQWVGGTDGGQAAVDWDTDFATGGSIENAKYIAVYHNYVILANAEDNGGTDYPARFYWSDLNDPDTWRTTQFIDLRPDDQCGGIGGMEVLGDRLVIFKERCGVFNILFTGDSDLPFVVQNSLCNLGTDSGYTIQEARNALIFYTRNIPGIYTYDGLVCKKATDRITPTIIGFDETTSSTMVAGIHPPLNQYWLSLRNAGSSENDRIIVWDFVNNAFSVHTGIEAGFMETVNKSGEFKLYTLDNNGFVLEQDTGNSDVFEGTASTTIDASIKTAWFPMQAPALTKGMYHTMVYHKLSGAYSVNFGYAFDFEDADQYSTSFSVSQGGTTWDFVWNQAEWASSGGGYVTRIDMTGAGAFLRYHIHNNEDVAAWEIYGITPIFRHSKVHRPSTLE